MLEELMKEHNCGTEGNEGVQKMGRTVSKKRLDSSQKQLKNEIWKKLRK